MADCAGRFGSMVVENIGQCRFFHFRRGWRYSGHRAFGHWYFVHRPSVTELAEAPKSHYGSQSIEATISGGIFITEIIIWSKFLLRRIYFCDILVK